MTLRKLQTIQNLPLNQTRKRWQLSIRRDCFVCTFLNTLLLFRPRSDDIISCRQSTDSPTPRYWMHGRTVFVFPFPFCRTDLYLHTNGMRFGWDPLCYLKQHPAFTINTEHWVALHICLIPPPVVSWACSSGRHELSAANHQCHTQYLKVVHFAFWLGRTSRDGVPRQKRVSAVLFSTLFCVARLCVASFTEICDYDRWQMIFCHRRSLYGLNITSFNPQTWQPTPRAQSSTCSRVDEKLPPYIIATKDSFNSEPTHGANCKTQCRLHNPTYQSTIKKESSTAGILFWKWLWQNSFLWTQMVACERKQ